MKLCYRGIEYDYTPPSLEVKDSEILGCYRGRPLHFSYISHVTVPQPVANLTYRGVPYTTTVEGHVRSATPVAALRQSVFQAIQAADNSGMQARRHLLQESAVAHRINIQRSLEHRLAVARAQGNEALVQQLEAEQHQLV
ncbi:MAG: DUF4278 domain-containing protein [Leptolyngbyaceae cyanobacterium SM2_5_2]|nr:DUF4278 domain-containing protein [Leptolyngbyaceae cyanobacterium SM2_5_2]